MSAGNLMPVLFLHFGKKRTDPFFTFAKKRTDPFLPKAKKGPTPIYQTNNLTKTIANTAIEFQIL